MLAISPRSQIDSMVLGEECAFKLDTTKELDTKTVNAYTYKVYDSLDVDVTTTMGGGSSILSGVITFGFKAAATGKYTLKFIVTCNETLPDSVTPYEFYCIMSMVVIA